MGRQRAGLRAKAIFVAAVGLIASLVPIASADLVAHGDLFVSFSGGISPAALPRRAPAPIAVSLAGRVRTLSGERPPALRKIVIDLNRAGQIHPNALPVCRRAQVVAASTRDALAECRDALVGRGRYNADTALPEQATFPSRGHILAFNSVSHDRPIILAHIFGTIPVAATRLIVFHISHPGGSYGVRLVGRLPSTVNRYGYITFISLRLHRTFALRRGRVGSYLTASCAAPQGFRRAAFPFAKAAMTFEDGRELSSTLTRSCRVLD
jgi:hypothetical protein